MSTWRRMRKRVEPMESRMASSRARSAARAAKMPARLVQAAASTNNASSMIPLRNGRAAPSMSPMSPGLMSRAERASS